MNYEEALQYIHSVSWKGSQPGLSRITELMRRLGNPERSLRFIHVVGTNGKGSTCAMLASILHAAGYRTGLFTSPYLVDFRERMQIDGAWIPEDELAQVTELVRPHIDATDDSPTEFERITAIALCWFARRGCDAVVLEAGMGGEYDATNVIAAKELAVFTNIGLDHMEFLGDTVEKIAATKAGILTPGCAAVLYPNTENVNAVIEAACARNGIPLYLPDFSAIRLKSADLDGQIFDYPPFSELFLPLLGAHQRKNAAVALTATEVLRTRRGDARIARTEDSMEIPCHSERSEESIPYLAADSSAQAPQNDNRGSWHIPDEAVRQGLASVSWSGRLEVVSRDPLLLLDGGHNPQCINALCEALDAYLPGEKLTVVTGVLADKDWQDMYARLLPYAAEFLCLTPDNPRALPARELAAYLSQRGTPARTFDTVTGALQAACTTGRPVLCCGSLYLIGEIKKTIACASFPSVIE